MRKHLDDIKIGDGQTSRIAYVLKPDALFVISIRGHYS